MTENGKPAKLLQDGEGNLDDKRIAGWIALIGAGILATVGVIKDSTTAVNIVYALLAFSAACLGITAFERSMK